MATMEPLILRLTEEWDEIVVLCDDLTEDEWSTPTELPGWTVKDCVSHVIGSELMLLGEPQPQVDVSHLAHLGDPAEQPFNHAVETWIEARRSTPGADVLAELRSVSIRRVAALRTMAPEQWDEPSWTPIGQAPYRTFMEVRVFDCWMHEQDVRRALHRTGHLEGPVVEVALGRIVAALGMIVGKRAQAPDGASVAIELVGPSARTIPVVVDGRARVVDEVPADPTATVRLGLEVLAALAGGRRDPAAAIEAGDVALGGDVELARRVVLGLPFTP